MVLAGINVVSIVMSSSNNNNNNDDNQNNNNRQSVQESNSGTESMSMNNANVPSLPNPGKRRRKRRSREREMKLMTLHYVSKTIVSLLHAESDCRILQNLCELCKRLSSSNAPLPLVQFVSVAFLQNLKGKKYLYPQLFQAARTGRGLQSCKAVYHCYTATTKNTYY